jgi:glycosyltransferase involved in cell wall biosynthesis
MFGRKTKFVVTPHGRFLSTPEQHQGLKKKILLGIKVAMWPYFRIFWAPLWDMVIQVNPDQTKWLRGEYGVNPKRIKLVPNGIDRDYIETKLPKKTNTPVIITYLGRISRYKGVGDLISAMKYLQLHHPALLKHVELKLLGKVFDQEVMDLIPSLGLEDVVTLVDTPSDEMRDHILTNESQINVLPSQWEATGIVLIEAMAKGNAIVSSDGNEMANELITPGENGYIFSYGDVPKLAEVLRILIENDKLRQHMIKTNLEQVQKYTWEFIFPVYLNLLKQLIK